MTTALRARPTTYNGIEMRSRLEARVAAWLDDVGIPWEYEPRAFASAQGQYLPDFQLGGLRDPFGREQDCFLDVKGELPDSGPLRELTDRMSATIGATLPSAMLFVADARMLERGLFLCAFPGDWRLAMLMRCPRHGELFFGIDYGDPVTYVGLCTPGCVGVAFRQGDPSDPRIGMPEYGS
jgi:hypothetical protein